MNASSVKGDTIEARLRCLGASEVDKVHGILYFATFEINGTEISYAYNINAKNKYFLQRIKPYPIPQGIFSDHDQVAEFIKRDLKKFDNAGNSHNFNQFISVTNLLSITSKELESFFLNYNVDKEFLEHLDTELTNIRMAIAEAKKRSEHILVK